MKNIYRVLSFFLIAILMLSLNLLVNAELSYVNLVDNANILTPDEEIEIASLLEETSIENNYNMMILTTDTLEGQFPTDTSSYSVSYINQLADVYCENYYMSQGFNFSQDGIIFLRYINEYDQYISITTFGDLRDFFDEEENDRIFDKIENFLKRDSTKVSQGFIKFIEVSSDDYASRNDLSFGSIVISLGISILIAVIIVFSMKAKLKSVDKKFAAKEYLKYGSFQLSKSNDVFLYQNVTKTRIQSSSSGGRSGGGGGGGGRTSGRRS